MVDASAFAEYLLRTAAAPLIDKLIAGPDMLLFVPALCDVELVAILRKSCLRGALSSQRMQEALTDYMDLPVDRHDHLGLLPRMLEMRDNFSSYDATYVALAEALDVPLLTADRRLARAVAAHTDVRLALPVAE